MRTVNANSSRAPRRLRSVFSLFSATALLGMGAFAPSAGAQAPTDKTDETKGNATKPAPIDPNLAPIGSGEIDPNQPLKPDFIISVSVVGEPEPSADYQIDSSGNVNVRYGGIATPVSVKGLTPSQAADAIAKLLKTYVRNPQVSVSIKAVPRPYVWVRGALAYNGPVVIAGDSTLADVLGKLTPLSDADLQHVYITPKGRKTGPSYNYERYIRPVGTPPDDTQNPTLHAGDAILVVYKPDTQAAGTGAKTTPGSPAETGPSISITGAVVKPQSNVPVRTDGSMMTLKEAVSLVGGLTPDANRHIVTVRHANAPDRPVVYDLEKADTDPSQNPELAPNDTVFVDKLQNNAYINVNGGIVKTGKYPYENRITLTQLIGDAGGLAPYAKEKSGRIFRHPDNDAAHTRIIPFNWKDISNGKERDIDLQSGDTVQITAGGPSTAPNFFTALSALGSLGFLIQGIRGYR